MCGVYYDIFVKNGSTNFKNKYVPKGGYGIYFVFSNIFTLPKKQMNKYTKIKLNFKIKKTLQNL